MKKKIGIPFDKEIESLTNNCYKNNENNNTLLTEDKLNKDKENEYHHKNNNINRYINSVLS